MIERGLIDKLVETLADIPSAYIDNEHRHRTPDSGIDATIEMVIDGRPISLIVEVKSSGFPRDVREAVWRLRDRHRGATPNIAEAVPVFVSETVSPGARDVLRRERIGYFDDSGSLHIPAHGAFILIERPLAKRQKRTINSVFQGRRAQIVHAAWVTPDEWFGVHELAEQAKVSPATASQTLIEMERRDWVEARGSGPAKERRLSDRTALLDAWSEYQRTTKPAPMRHYYVPGGQVAQVLAKLQEAAREVGADYEVTGQVAGQAYSPYMTRISQIQCRIGADRIGELMSAIDARSVNEGWNLSVIEVEGQGDFAFSKQIDGVWMADPLQVYLDLLQGGGRAREFAEHFRREKLEA